MKNLVYFSWLQKSLLLYYKCMFWVKHFKLFFVLLLNWQDAVTVVGYPLGGDTISVTKGVVSRIEVWSLSVVISLKKSSFLLFLFSSSFVAKRFDLSHQTVKLSCLVFSWFLCQDFQLLFLLLCAFFTS